MPSPDSLTRKIFRRHPLIPLYLLLMAGCISGSVRLISRFSPKPVEPDLELGQTKDIESADCISDFPGVFCQCVLLSDFTL